MSFTQLYGDNRQNVLDEINQGEMPMGACAKTLDVAEVAWRCMDCEKDPTSIFCKECFERSDHQGHRVKLLRNVGGGQCDCGDPESWDEKHFCSSHTGVHNVDAQQVILGMPAATRKSAHSVFGAIMRNLKVTMMHLQNFEDKCMQTIMDEHDFKATMIKCIQKSF